ncbi:Type 1 glutamine amidotransferase-like domain-containing protein [Herbiconiux sp. SYSU D00978]|uniref:Type 1 glutamine amidotransferase-like domain-containing protein n=1 Tax=Herbiconiux sp. SYSU D00978 TaxID=2812562 RepID=UPI001A95CDBC|nr:Type 1 glutamine amidotransferase-like domain-containing protein [Herbiconiux sp. SYSU D00978]
MSVHLAGGGWDAPDPGLIYRGFVDEAAERALRAGRRLPRISVLLVAEDADGAVAVTQKLRAALAAAGRAEPVFHTIDEGQKFTSVVLSEIDGVLVAGGLTPAYLEAVSPIAGEIRLLVSDGLPYLGFSAGAAIAADRAVIGGWRIGGIPVVHENAGEDLDEVTVAEGLALVDLAIDVHAAQWGTLGRLIAATEAGLVEGGVAIDENTVLIVGEGVLRVEGTGSVWRITEGDDAVQVSTLGA